MVTMGDNETTLTNATSPETFVIGVSSSHFTLSTTGITRLSISGVSATSGSRTAPLTPAHTGDVSPGATVAMVDPAAHSGTNTLTSKACSMLPGPSVAVNAVKKGGDGGG